MLIDNIQLLAEFKDMFIDTYIHFFIAAALFDIATGITKGFFVKEAQSTKALLGIVKHMLIVLLVLFVYPYMQLLNLGGFATLFVFFYIATYTISIIENLSALGVPFPSFIKERFERLKDQADKGNMK